MVAWLDAYAAHVAANGAQALQLAMYMRAHAACAAVYRRAHAACAMRALLLADTVCWRRTRVRGGIEARPSELFGFERSGLSGHLRTLAPWRRRERFDSF